MRTASLVVLFAALSAIVTGCAAGNEPDEQPSPVTVQTEETDDGKPEEAATTGGVQTKMLPGQVCRWMTCIEKGERFKCWVCI